LGPHLKKKKKIKKKTKNKKLIGKQKIHVSAKCKKIAADHFLYLWGKDISCLMLCHNLAIEY